MGLLNAADKEKLKRAIPKANNKIIDSTVARLYIAYPDHTKWQYTGLLGAIALVDDLVGHTFFLKLVDIIENRGVIWDQELYVNFEYHQDRTFFHTFEIEECLVGLLFEDTSEAAHFLKRVTNRNKYGSKHTVNNKQAIALKKDLGPEQAKIGPRGEYFDSITTQRTRRSRGVLYYDDKPPLEWRSLYAELAAAGITEDMIAENREFIKEYISRQGGPLVGLEPPIPRKYTQKHESELSVDEKPPTPVKPKHKKAAPPPPPPPAVSKSPSPQYSNSKTNLSSTSQEKSSEALVSSEVDSEVSESSTPVPEEKPAQTPQSRFKLPPVSSIVPELSPQSVNHLPPPPTSSVPYGTDHQTSTPTQAPYGVQHNANARPTPSNSGNITSQSTYNQVPPPYLNQRAVPPPPPPRATPGANITSTQGRAVPVPPPRFGTNLPPPGNTGGPPPAPPPRGARGPAPPAPPSRTSRNTATTSHHNAPPPMVFSPNQQPAGFNQQSAGFNQQSAAGFNQQPAAGFNQQPAAGFNQPAQQGLPPPPPHRDFTNTQPTPPTSFGGNNRTPALPPQVPDRTTTTHLEHSRPPPQLPQSEMSSIPTNDFQNATIPPPPPMNTQLNTSSGRAQAPPPPPPLLAQAQMVDSSTNGSSGPPPPPPPLPEGGLGAGDTAAAPALTVDPSRDALLASIRGAGLGSLKKVDKSQLDRPSVILQESSGASAQGSSTNGGAAPAGPPSNLADALASALSKRKGKVARSDDEDDNDDW